MSAGEICSRILATASPDESVRAAARRMAEYGVGTLVVVKENLTTRAVGVITDRDIAIRCVAEGRNPEGTPVADVMSTPVHSVSDDTALEAALAKMALVGTRRLVVTSDSGRLAGILTLDDVLDQLGREVLAVGRLIGKQQPHVPA